ncbi:MAG: cell division protein ZapA [Robiginitomaculum sp.]|nr:MAG: cell division protein ZapA [Robiginitomaculum sp.]
MGKVSINVNGRAFAVGCEDGEEEAVAELGRQFDQHVSMLADQVGQIGDLRLFLMAALVLADELRESKRTSAALETRIDEFESSGTEGARQGVDATKGAAKALNKAAMRVEKLAEQLNQSEI